MPAKIEVYKKGSARFDMTGGFLGYPLSLVSDGIISAGLVARLELHARRRMRDAGFPSDWPAIVITNDADRKPAERYYSVAFTNGKDGKISVDGILTFRGWPHLDHGFSITDR